MRRDGPDKTRDVGLGAQICQSLSYSVPPVDKDTLAEVDEVVLGRQSNWNYLFPKRDADFDGCSSSPSPPPPPSMSAPDYFIVLLCLSEVQSRQVRKEPFDVLMGFIVRREKNDFLLPLID